MIKKQIYNFGIKKEREKERELKLEAELILNDLITGQNSFNMTWICKASVRLPR